MKTRIIHTKIYMDEWFRSLKKSDQYLFIYLLTNEHINLMGCYHLIDDIICAEFQIDKKELQEAKGRLQPKVYFKDGWIYLPNSTRYNGYNSSKLMKPLVTEYEAIPKDIVDTLSIPYPYCSDTTINHKSEIINNKSKTINHKQEGWREEVYKNTMELISKKKRI